MGYIKSMTCQGFKSFKHLTKVKFDRGFTSIVGANGSGKSNVIDAFIFVLGELSAKTLRAKNMSDLICNGGKNDKAASQFAFVEIEFDNADRQIPLNEDCVTVSRKIDREGKGEYRLNGKRSTRAEILEVLDLANLKPTSSNLILQGELFRLINMNTLERRQLLDDIAGVATYDEKKKSAQTELETIEQNLTQVTLILNEVSVQLDKLEKERDDALKFLQISKEKDAAENAILVKRVQEFEEEMSRLREIKAGLEGDLRNLEEQREKQKKIIAELEVELAQYQSEIRAKETTEIAALATEIGAKKDHLTQLNTTRKHLKKQRDDTEKRLHALESESQKNRVERDNLETDLASAEEERVSLERDLQEKNQSHAIALDKLKSQDAEFTALKAHIQELKDQIAKVTADRGEVLSDLKIAQNTLSQLHKERQRKERELQSIQEKLGKIKLELAQMSATQGSAPAGETRTSVEALENQSKTLSTTLRQLQGTIAHKQEEVSELRSKLRLLKKADSGSQAVTEILTLRDSGRVRGIFGTIAQLGTCNQEYTIALEIAGGAGFTYVVVDTQDTAQSCIEYLKQNRFGRVTFIPLDKIAPRPFVSQLPASDAIIGRAVDLIEFNPRYRQAFEFVFGRSVIVRDLNTAKRLNVPARRVTLEGDVVEGSNLMTGGTVRKGNGLSFNPKEAQLLPVLEQELDALKAREEQIQEEIKTLQARVSSAYREKISHERETSKNAAIYSRLEEDRKTLENEEPQILAIVDKVQADIRQVTMDVESLQRQVADLDARIAALQAQRQSLDDQVNNSEESALRKEVLTYESAIESLKKRVQAWEVSVAKKRTRLEDSLVKRISELSREMADITKAIQDFDAEQIALQDEKQAVSDEVARLESTYAAKNQEVAAIFAKKTKLFEDMTKGKLALDQINSAIHATQLKANTSLLKLEEVQRERDAIKVQVKPNISFDPQLLEIPRDQLQQRVELLGSQKRALEPVNMKAIDAFDAAQTRFNDLKAKHEKIVLERESILTFMAEVEAEKKKVFMDTFTAINRNFGFIFSKLSPNGEAKLELEDEEDPFAGGINMLARPGGKKWCLTQAMSGGEKTLTVIALVLGIQLYVPSPYYILDEIDAALDDANAGVVAELINELANKSQFILITHRDVTMARSNQLLGVTNDDGITRVVNLNIDEVLKQLASNPAQ